MLSRSKVQSYPGLVEQAFRRLDQIKSLALSFDKIAQLRVMIQFSINHSAVDLNLRPKFAQVILDQKMLKITAIDLILEGYQ